MGPGHIQAMRLCQTLTGCFGGVGSKHAHIARRWRDGDANDCLEIPMNFSRTSDPTAVFIHSFYLSPWKSYICFQLFFIFSNIFPLTLLHWNPKHFLYIPKDILYISYVFSYKLYRPIFSYWYPILSSTYSHWNLKSYICLIYSYSHRTPRFSYIFVLKLDYFPIHSHWSSLPYICGLS